MSTLNPPLPGRPAGMPPAAPPRVPPPPGPPRMPPPPAPPQVPRPQHPLGRVPRRPADSSAWPGFLVALVMHGALVGYLWIAMQWHTTVSAPAVAVLWDLPAPVEPPTPAPPAVQDTPPPPKEETPAPPKPDIVEKVEKKPKPMPEPKSKPKPVNKPSPQELRRQQQQAEKQHAEEMARLTSQVGTPGRIPQVASAGRLSNEYEARVRAAVLANVHFAPPEGVDDGVYAEVEVDLIPSTGELVGDPQLVHASGLPGWDDAVRRAILRTDPFPRREDGTAPRTLRLRFRPTDTR